MGLKIVRLTIALVLSLAIVGISYSAVPWNKYSYFQNSSGLNDNLSSTEIADNEASDLQNIVFDSGYIQKRDGYATIPSDTLYTISNGTGVIVTGLYFYQKNDGNRYLLALGHRAGMPLAYKKTYAVGGGLPSGAWDSITSSGTMPATGYDEDYLVSFATAEDNAIIAFKTTTGVKPFKWTGTGLVSALTADSDCPNVSVLIYHKNHLFTNDLTYPSRIWFSKLDDITDYTATDFIDIQTNDGTKVRGMISVFDSLYIFKDKSIWRLSGYDRDSWVLDKMVEGTGTLSHQSLCFIDNAIHFTTNQNEVAVYDGGYNVTPISDNISNVISGLNFSRATNNLGINYDDDFYASVSNAGSATHNRILFYDTAHKAWSKFVGINANAWCVGKDSAGEDILIFGDYSGYVHYYPSGSYYDGDVNDTAIDAYYQTKWFRYPELSLGDKYFRLLKTYALSETSDTTYLTTEVKSDYETTGKKFGILLTQAGSLWDIAKWDIDEWGGQTLIIDRAEIEKGKHMFQLKFSNDVVNQGFTIFGFETFLEPAEGGV